MGEVSQSLNATGGDLSTFPIRPNDLSSLIRLVGDNYVSRTAARVIFAKMLESGLPPAQIAADEKLLQVGDEVQVARWIDDVFAEHPLEAQRFLAGEKKLQGVLVGLVMKKSNGSANPKKVNAVLAARSA